MKLVIVTGAGRTGTSTMAGTLKMLGAHVPQPEMPPTEANPRGHFEPKWVVDFHRRLLGEAGVRILDARPDARQMVAATATAPEHFAELRDWFATQPTGPLIVVKDPRTFWVHDLWAAMADDLGVTTGFVTMLRHPAEVVGSWDMHYLKKADRERRLARETSNLAGWVNVSLTNELVTRGHRRAFVPYPDLITDWRASMINVARRLELTFDVDLAAGEKHEVDDFIDVDLRRSRLSWDDLDVPESLREIAQAVNPHLDLLAKDPQDAGAIAGNDEMRREYDRLHQHSAALVHHQTNAAIAAARAEERREVTRELKKKSAPKPPPSITRRVVRKLRAMRARS